MVEDPDGVLEDPGSLVGQQATVSAAVSEVLAGSDVGSAFRIGEESGGAIPVITVSPPPRLDAGDVVRVSGTVRQVRPDTFEQDFGIAADELFDDPDGFLSTYEGEVAVAADGVEVLQEQGEG